MDLKEMVARVTRVCSDQDNVLFAADILAAQLGRLPDYRTHDPVLRERLGLPVAREHGSPAEEESSWGHALVWLLRVASLRGVDIGRGFETAMKALGEDGSQPDWQHRGASEWVDGRLRGVTDWVGEVSGVVGTTTLANIIVGAHFGPEVASMAHYTAIIADQGGLLCHAAIVARERGVPFIVGVGNARRLLKDGTRVRLRGDGAVGTIEVLP